MEYFSLEEGDAHGTISTCVLVASYDEEKSTEISPDVTMVSTAPGVVLTEIRKSQAFPQILAILKKSNPDSQSYVRRTYVSVKLI